MLLLTFGLFGQISSLKQYYLTTVGVPGGSYVEAEQGHIKLINPILPENSVSGDVTRLVFSGLTRYNAQRVIEPDLATSWTISPDGRTYTFNLRHDVKWHDGVPFTARDVAFTVTAIQNPDTRSPLSPSWLNVKAEPKDDYTVVFTLPNPYSPFIDSTTFGILPSHILEASDPSSLRIAPFNQQPIGTGPFKVKNFAVSEGEIELEANNDYYGGRPKLDGFEFKMYDNYDQMLDAYAKRQVNGISRWRPDEPSSKRTLANLKQSQLSLPDQTDLFLRTTSGALIDKNVRQALVKATDRTQIIHDVLGDQALLLNSPLLPGQVGYDAQYRQSGYNQAAAADQLTTAGWSKDNSGVLAKDGQQLKLRLVTLDSGQYPKVAEMVKKQWAKLGVTVDIKTADATTLQQSYIRARNYDVLLYGINIGADPDVYVYWHSSQANDPGLNLSQYSSPAADKALESARLSSDDDIRTGKYRTFLQTWTDDAPAVVLYQPNYIYAYNSNLLGFKAHRLVDPADRFYGVEKWTIKTVQVARGN